MRKYSWLAFHSLTVMKVCYYERNLWPQREFDDESWIFALIKMKECKGVSGTNEPHQRWEERRTPSLPWEQSPDDCIYLQMDFQEDEGDFLSLNFQSSACSHAHKHPITKRNLEIIQTWRFRDQMDPIYVRDDPTVHVLGKCLQSGLWCWLC